MNFKAVVFDWDGTLVDSEAHIVESISHAAAHAGLPELSYERKKSIIGLGMREALLDLYPELNDEHIKKLREYYAEHFFSRATESHNLFEGVEATLLALRDKGVRLAVATGKSRNGLDKALASSGLGHFFEIERCADETRSKPHPMMLEQIASHFEFDYGDMLMVGDTSFDLDMAKQVGMPAVAVSYGVHERHDLLTREPLALVDSLEELLRWFD